MTVKLHFHGAAASVTGSCYRLETGSASVLIDCGLFQGPKTLKSLNYRPFPFDPGRIDAVLLTHAHIDHSGQLPKLKLAGFDGRIHATASTRELAAVMLPDAGGIQEHEVEQLNRRFRRRGRPAVEPIYTARDAAACLQLFSTVRYDTWIDVARGIRARWWDAGHMLGSASIEVEVGVSGSEVLRLLFSGDLGRGGGEFLSDPEGPSGVDHLILESTYGSRERPAVSAARRREALAAEVIDAHRAGGPLLIPAFAVERTQELITDLVDLMNASAVPEARIFLDSPLAIRASEVFYRHGADEAGDNPFARARRSSLLHTTESADESRAIEQLRGWHIIVAASGMCDAGRIRHHLKRLLWRPETTLLLTGYQATGTLGRLLQQGARHVTIQGDEIQVRARIREFDAYSGHADAPALVAWTQARRPIGDRIFLTHGEPDSREALRERLVAAGFDEGRIESPEIDDCFELTRKGARHHASRPRLEPGAAARLDWHNARTQLLMRLSERLEDAPDDQAREALLASLMQELERKPEAADRFAAGNEPLATIRAAPPAN